MTNKTLLTITSLTGALASFLPWVTGPFGMSLSGIDGDGVLSAGALFILAILNFMFLDVYPNKTQKVLMYLFSGFALFITVFTTIQVGAKFGMDTQYSSMFSIAYGLLIALISSAVSFFLVYDIATKGTVRFTQK